MAKNDHFHEGGKVERSNANSNKLLSVDSYDLKFMSFKFGNDIFITFEMPRSSFLMILWKNPFRCYSLLSVIRGPCTITYIHTTQIRYVITFNVITSRVQLRILLFSRKFSENLVSKNDTTFFSLAFFMRLAKLVSMQ